MSFIKNKAIWIICVISFFSALFYNQLNVSKTPKNQLRENRTVITNDDISYLTPPTNYLKTGEWKSNSIGKQSYFIRTPGYGLFYMIFLLIADYPLSLSLLKIAQLLLFSCSVFWLYKIALSIVNNKKIALIIAGTYGITPFTIGFLYYTLTEGISPALLLLYVFLLVKAFEKSYNKHKLMYYLFASLTFAYLLIVRPPLGFMGILLPVFIVKDYWKQKLSFIISKLLFFGIIAFSFMAIWQYRNYKIVKKYVGLHPIYYSDNNSIYRPTFKEYWNFAGGWAQEGHEVHSYMVPMWEAAIKGDTSEYYIKNAIATFPKKITTHFGENRLFQVFKKYQQATLHQKRFYDKGDPMPTKIPFIEQEVVNDLKALTNEFKKEFWFDYYIKSPLKVLKTMTLHSNLSLYIFQHTYRGNTLMEVVRIIFFGLHLLCFIGVFLGLLFYKNWMQRIITLCVFAYIFYLCYFQRGIEERYTLPIIPLLLVGLGSLLNNLIDKYRIYDSQIKERV